VLIYNQLTTKNKQNLLTKLYSLINLKEGGICMELQKVQRTTLTMKEAAEYLGISYWLINQLVRRKQIPCSKVGGKFLFRIQVLDEYLSRKEKESIKY
jgi:DNA binding domain protein, excisionase family